MTVRPSLKCARARSLPLCRRPRLIVRRPVDRRDCRPHRPRAPQLHTHHDADERRDHLEKAHLVPEHGQKRVACAGLRDDGRAGGRGHGGHGGVAVFVLLQRGQWTLHNEST